jgi:hypothetical protein
MDFHSVVIVDKYCLEIVEIDRTFCTPKLI